MKIPIKDKLNLRLHLHFYLILNILCCISCFVNIKLGIVVSLFIVFLVISRFDVSLFAEDIPFILYLFCNLVSFVAYLWNDRPIKIFFAAISFNFIPSLLYYLGKYIASKKEEELFINKMLNAIIVMMLIGTVTYLLVPSFYYKYIGYSIEYYALGLGEYRYGSFISSLAMGSIGTIAIVLYFYRFTDLELWKKITYLPLILLNVALCMQRAAWIVGVLALFSCLLLQMKGSIKAKIGIIVFALLLLGGCVVVYSFREVILTESQLQYFESRLSVFNISDMIKSRSDQWKKAWEVFLEYPIPGYGLGSCGQKAAAYGMAIVTDGNHMRILAETGFIGLFSFLVMNICAVVKAIKNKKYYFFLVILFCNLAAVGSPIFDQFYSCFAYWLILGIASFSVPAEEMDRGFEVNEEI